MLYFDPIAIPPDVLERAGISNLTRLKISKDPESKPLECLNNVNAYIAQYGGKLQFGWLLTTFGNIALKLTAHAVVRKKDRTLVCITLDNHRDGKVNFAPDDEIQNLIRNNFLPARFIPLIDNEVLKNYLALMDEENSLRLNSSSIFSDPQQYENLCGRAKRLYPELLVLAKENTSLNDLCFCGSRAKRKNCCG